VQKVVRHLKIKAIGSSETSILILTTRQYIPEDGNNQKLLVDVLKRKHGPCVLHGFNALKQLRDSGVCTPRGAW
jgi:hypothetical protein